MFHRPGGSDRDHGIFSVKLNVVDFGNTTL
ncbi:hypothetical protein NORO109296_23850 [Nocardiopsis rhodophaea]